MLLRALGIGPAASLLASGRLTAREPLLVTDFTVRQGDSTLASVVSEAVRASLAQSNAVTVVSPTLIANALQRMQRPAGARLDVKLAREVAQREGIKAIVDGDVAALGGGYAVTVRLLTADSGTVLATAQKVVDGPKELIAAADAIGRELRGKMGESLRSVQNAAPLEQVTTPSIEALRLYSEGARAYDVGGDATTATMRLRQALAIDTGFAMAWRKLGTAYGAGGQYPQSLVDSAYQQAYRFRDRLTPRERLLTVASYFGGPGHDRARAAAAYEQLLAQGDSDIALNNYAIIQTSRRRYASAESLLIAATRLRAGQTQPWTNLAVTQADARNFDKVAQTLAASQKALGTPGARASVLSIGVWTRDASGDVEGAERLADSLGSSDVPFARWEALTGRAGLSALRGRAEESRARFAAVHAFGQTIGIRSLAINDSIVASLIDVGRDQPARAVARLDAALGAEPLHTLAESDRNYAGIASIYAQAGRPDKAKAVLAQRAADIRDTAWLRSEEPLAHRVLGDIAVAEGHPTDAIREFWKGDSLADGPYDDCDACTFLSVARAYDKANVPDSSITYFEKYFASGYYLRLSVLDLAYRAPAARRLGELYEAKNDRVRAAHYYQMFVDLWKNADPELQPQVADIKRRLARLGDLEKK
jgi:tetratricopeptide (TPR) repeat protein